MTAISLELWFFKDPKQAVLPPEFVSATANQYMIETLGKSIIKISLKPKIQNLRQVFEPRGELLIPGLMQQIYQIKANIMLNDLLSGLNPVTCRKVSLNDSSSDEGTPRPRGSIKLATPQGLAGKEVPITRQCELSFSFREK